MLVELGVPVHTIALVFAQAPPGKGEEFGEASPIALVVIVPLLYLAGQVLAARDARRFVIGLGTATVAWFVIWYPNLAALPLPSTVVNAYQGFLPTYLYAFQFPVNTAARPPAPSPSRPAG